MYLTRFRFNTARRESRRLLSGPQHLHAAVLHAFPEPERMQGDAGRILWRLDAAARHDAVLYLASPEEPDLSHLVEQAGWPARGLADGWDTRPYDKLLDALETGQQWAFRLTANPVHFARSKPGGPKRWVPHTTVEHQRRWLLDRAERSGFTIAGQTDGTPNLVIRDRTWLQFAKTDAPRNVTLTTATYEGVLAIDDPEAMRHTMTHGLGKAKAYGCGMLTLAPLPGRR